MDHVLHVLRTPVTSQVAADRSRGRERRIRRPHEDANALDHPVTLDDNRHKGTRAHELEQAGEEVLIAVLRVVLLKQFFRGPLDFKPLST